MEGTRQVTQLRRFCLFFLSSYCVGIETKKSLVLSGPEYEADDEDESSIATKLSYWIEKMFLTFEMRDKK